MPYVSPADRDGPVQSARTRFKVTEVILHVKPSNELAIELYTSLKFYTTETKPRFCKSVPNDVHKNLWIILHRFWWGRCARHNSSTWGKLLTPGHSFEMSPRTLSISEVAVFLPISP